MTATLNGHHAPTSFSAIALDDERIALAFLLTQPTAPGASLIGLDLFIDADHRQIAAEAIAAAEDGPIDLDSIAQNLVVRGMRDDEVCRRMQELIEFGDVAKPERARGAIRRLQQRRERMRTIDEIDRVRRELDAGLLEPQEGIARIEAVRERNAATAMLSLPTLSEAMADPADETHDRILTGLRFVDDAIELQPGHKVVAGAPPGVGKTTLMLQIDLGILTTNPTMHVLWCAAEMTLKQLRNRALQCITGMTRDLLRRPWDDLSPLQVESKRRGIDTLRQIGSRFHFHGSPITPASIEAQIIRTKASVVTIDYVQLIRSGGEHATRRDDLDAVLQALCSIAQRHGVVLFVLSNMRSGDTRGRDIYSGFKETSELGHMADVAFVGEFIEHYDDDPPAEVPVRWRALKDRHNQPRSMMTVFRRHVQRFEGCST